MKLSDVYQIILYLQKKLHSEYATSVDITEAFIEKISKNFTETFQAQQIQNKNYYSIIFFLIYYKNTKKLPFVDSNTLLLEEVQQKDVVIPNKFKASEEKDADDDSLFITLLKLVESDNLSSIFEDFITFSIIPSLFLMFSEDYSFYLYCNFIEKFKKKYEDKKIVKPMHYCFSRSLFLSPMFLNFLRLTLYPLLKPYSNCQELTDNFQEDIQNQILKSFERNISLIPSYMKIFFDILKDTANFLKNCLIEPIIENPEFFLVVDSLITDNEDVMNHFRKILKVIFTDKLIEDISKIIDDCKNTEKALFKREERYIYAKIISSLDLDAFKFINESLGKEEEKKSKKDFFESLDISNYQYKLCRSLYEDENEGIDPIILYNMPNFSFDEYWMPFISLLRNGPPLPSDYQPPDEEATPETFKEMIKQLLVDTCDPATKSDVTALFNEFEKRSQEKINEFKQSILTNDHKFLDHMKKIMALYKEKVKEKKIESEYPKELVLLKEKKISTSKLIQELYYTILTKPLIPENQSKIQFNEILSNIVKYNEEFQLYLVEQKKKSAQLLGKFGDDNKCNEIWFHRFYQSINFSSYCSYRSDLQKFDKMVQKAFQKYVTLDNSIIMDRKAVVDAISNINLFEKEFLQLNQAFLSNSDPLTKYNKINNAMNNILLLFQKHFGAQSEDDFCPFRSLVIAHVNPPHFFTNMIYLSEFLMYKSTTHIVDDVKFNQLLFSYILVCNELKNSIELPPKFYYYSRPHHRYLDVFILGNDPDSIIDLFKSFVSLTDNETPSNDELNSYIENIKSNPKQPVKYTLDFENFSDLSKHTFNFPCSVITNFFIGQDIKFTSESKTSIKLALYAYKSVKGFSFSNLFSKPANDFINTNDVPNSNKFVVCDPAKIADDLNLPKSILSNDFKEVSQTILKRIFNKNFI